MSRSPNHTEPRLRLCLSFELGLQPVDRRLDFGRPPQLDFVRQLQSLDRFGIALNEGHQAVILDAGHVDAALARH
jgi:hypothetical protein